MSERGKTFAKYRLLARLGHGGMADVYLALSAKKGFKKLQVLKVLRPHLTELSEFVTMFEEEGKLAARLNHPHIVQTNQIGREAGRYFIAMEYLDGQSLYRVRQRAKKRGGMPLAFQIHVLMETLDALAYAHDLEDYDGSPLGIVHRDVTPQNVFVTYAGVAKLVDFGIAKTMESTETESGVLKGKVSYMPPEQAARDGVDRRADLFAVGVMLWEAAAGRRMWADYGEVEILKAVFEGVPDLREALPEVDEELASICDRALATSPEDRYPDADAFRQDLETFVVSRGLGVSPRDMGRWAEELFEHERAEIAEIIREELQDVTQYDMDEIALSESIDPDSMDLQSIRSIEASIRAASADLERESDPESEQTAGPVNVPSHPQAKPRWSMRTIVAAVGLVLAGMALAVTTLTPSNDDVAVGTHSAPQPSQSSGSDVSEKKQPAAEPLESAVSPTPSPTPSHAPSALPSAQGEGGRAASSPPPSKPTPGAPEPKPAKPTPKPGKEKLELDTSDPWAP